MKSKLSALMLTILTLTFPGCSGMHHRHDMQSGQATCSNDAGGCGCAEHKCGCEGCKRMEGDAAKSCPHHTESEHHSCGCGK